LLVIFIDRNDMQYTTGIYQPCSLSSSMLFKEINGTEYVQYFNNKNHHRTGADPGGIEPLRDLTTEDY